MVDHGTGAARLQGMATWIPFTCATCGGLRDGEDGPPWPFHAKGFHPCECDEEDRTLAEPPTPPPVSAPGDEAAAGP